MLRMMAPRSTTTPPTTPPTLAIAPIGFDLVVDEDDEGLPTSESPTERHESTIISGLKQICATNLYY